MLSSKNEIIEKEVKLWIYDFDNIKCSNEIKAIILNKLEKINRFRLC